MASTKYSTTYTSGGRTYSGEVLIADPQPAAGAATLAACEALLTPIQADAVVTAAVMLDVPEPIKVISAATTNATLLKGHPGEVLGIQAMNLNAAAVYVKIYNKATAPTVGTDTPVKVLMVPGNTAGAGFIARFGKPVECDLGVGLAITAGIADSDTTAVAASEVVVNVDVK